MASKAKDDLGAVRDIAALLEEFSNDERERIIRWVREKLGMISVAAASTQPATQVSVASPATAPVTPPPATDMRTFVAQKNPKNDKQLAAVVAYYHRFMAAGDQRKESISSGDLIEACRVADRGRPASAAQTLVNAFHDGFMDRAERGAYKLNTVGENLVAMVLPDGNGGGESRRPSGRRGAPKQPKKRTARNKK